MVTRGKSPTLPRKRAARQRGAAVFVVVMAITMLTAVGLFAAYSATLVDQAAGYDRLAQQTLKLAEYGLLTASAELSSGTAKDYMTKMQEAAQPASDPSLKRPTCTANAGLPSLPCYQLKYDELTVKTKQTANESLLEDQAGAVEDVVGNGDARGDFFVELTEPSPVTLGVTGSELSDSGSTHFKYLRITTTTFANYRPAGATACTNSVATMSGQQSVRAHLIVGPIQE